MVITAFYGLFVLGQPRHILLIQGLLELLQRIVSEANQLRTSTTTMPSDLGLLVEETR